MKPRSVALILLLLFAWTPKILANDTVLTIALGWGLIPEQFSDAVTRYTEKTGVRFEIVGPQGNVEQYHESMLVQFAAGAAPDLLFVEGRHIEQFVALNLLLPLDSFYARDVDFSEYLPIFDSSRVGGKLFGFPAEGGGYRVNALFINRDMFEAAGIPAPGPRIEEALTYRELLDVARRLTTDKNNDGQTDQWGINFGFGWGVWTGWLPSNGARVFNEEKTQVLLNSPEALEVFELLRDLNVTYGARGGGLPAGTAAMQFAVRASVSNWQSTIGSSFDWSVAPVAQGKAGSVGVLNMNSIAISAESDRAEEAWKFILHLMSEDEQDHKAAEGTAVARRSSAVKYQSFNHPPYDLTPFLYGPTVNRQSMTMPGGAPWPAEVDRILREVIEGALAPEIGLAQAADTLRMEITR